MSLCPAVADAVRVWPSCAVPPIVGVVTVGAASETDAVPALLADVVAPFSLVAVAITTILVPSSLSCRVYVAPVAPTILRYVTPPSVEFCH